MENCAELLTKVDEIGRYGAAVFEVTAETFYKAGFACGDIVTVSVGEKEYTAPVGTGYTDVEDGKHVLLKIEFEDRILLAVSNRRGFAQKEGILPGQAVKIRMKEKAGYLKEYELRSMTMGTDRAEYGSDEAFCNFRAVKVGKMKEDYLYRGFSPINPMENRAPVADRLLSETGVKTVINLDGESPEERRKYEGYEKSYYAGLNIVPLKTGFSARDEGFDKTLSSFVRILLKEEGPFYVHCRYGRDRTGLLCMVLEGVCEADFTELADDYMLSFENIHGLVKHSEKWELVRENMVCNAFYSLTGVSGEGLPGKEVSVLMEKRLSECGVTEKEIRDLKKKFCEKKARKGR